MAELKLTLAVEHYDRHLPLLQGQVKAEGIELDVQCVSVDEGRHDLMLDEQAWDVCELSLSSYIMAKDRGVPLTSIPVFPRRLFSQSQMYVNTDAGVREPRDLVGKRVALRAYQTTLSVLAKGDLQHEYGVGLDQVTWVTSVDEPVAFQPPSGVDVQRAPPGKNIEDMLVQGEVDAYFVPRMPLPFVDGSPQVSRLFADSKAEEIAYHGRNGFYPIMHLVAVKSELMEQHPWAAMNLYHAFEAAKETAAHYYDDPNWSSLAWAPQLLQEERKVMGPDPWPNGIARNRKNLERFIQYEEEQGLIAGRLEVDELFHPSTLDT